ncbi:MAG TPA: FAD-dependent monooxygenase, partial [Myxococcota bacterium]
MRRPGRSVAILGGGPAGATLGTLLARAGFEVVLFARGGRPPIVIGESLVPACMPFLSLLGVKEEVASYSVWKGGATFVLSRDARLNFRFAEVRGARSTHS